MIYKILITILLLKTKIEQKLKGNWLNTLGCIHNMEYYTALKLLFKGIFVGKKRCS